MYNVINIYYKPLVISGQSIWAEYNPGNDIFLATRRTISDSCVYVNIPTPENGRMELWEWENRIGFMRANIPKTMQ